MIGVRVTPYKEVPFDESPQGLLFFNMVNNEEYLGGRTIIDNSEYIELENKIKFIKQKFTVYINNYIKYVNSKNIKMIEIISRSIY